ncbi:ParA family protein [Vibrio europaeus]|uniref:ParA family protein n=1 Tax=Vibrio europaeus TaxID=300876 RepID=UPI00233F1F0A|nr:ParA family protein [Vibrio europaeus]MDC5753546.1 ParA family protein [Vibrio europaeus]MDC5816542.1 ParA family protein [Vibrio europaeus]
MDSTHKLQQIAESLKLLSASKKDDQLQETSNGKRPRTYNKAEAIEATGAGYAQKLNEACVALNINTKPNVDNKSLWRISISDVQRLREYFGHAPFVRSPEMKVIVFVVETLKGGAGKTTECATISVGFSTELMTKYRVGVIDLDPQGTLTALVKPNMSEEDFTAGDLMMKSFELDEGETFEQVCKDAFLPTNTPNLRVLPAGINDMKFDIYTERRKIDANEKGEMYNPYLHLQDVIDAVEDEFDIIFIDTPPNLNPAAMSAHYAASHIAIPLRASENDRDAAYKHMEYLAEVNEILTSLGQREKNDISLILSGVDRRSPSLSQSVLEIREAVGQHCYHDDFTHSDAVTRSAKEYLTVFDLSPSGSKSRQSLKSAQEQYRKIIEELEVKALRYWGVQ